MDETLPLLEHQHDGRPAVADDRIDGLSKAQVVDFDPEGDDENPLDWPQFYKWGIVLLLALTAFTVTFTCIGVVPIASAIAEDLDRENASKSASVLLVTIWELGEAAGPLLIAPLSEVFGRYPVINVANVLFIVATALAAMSESTGVFIGARALTGLAVASNVLNPAIIGDMFVSEQRGSAMSAIMLAPLIGGAVGPALSGAIAQELGWRRVVWISVALATACELLFLTCFRETYKVPILRRRAARLRKETDDQSLRTVFDLEDGSGASKMWESILRPGVVLASSGVLQAIALFGALVFTYFYVMSTSLPDILQDLYGLSPAGAGLCFVFFSIGSALSVAFCNVALDRIYIRLRNSHGGIGGPEFRLPLVIVGGTLLPLVVSLYGWAAELRIPLPFLLLSLGLMGSSLMLAFLPLMAYVVDAFGIYSASALTAVIVSRCLMGTFLPLATQPLVERFGYGWGLTLMGSAQLALLPIPVLVMRYGLRWRQKSKYSRDQ
ncbi:major facilitator superfamily transporter [Thozetella sp. PMI_491]|nr:major facilitator superfamily transporter [Thozetella sp. PMI_491]